MIELEFDDGTRYRVTGKLKAIHHVADADAAPVVPEAPAPVAPEIAYYSIAEVATILGISRDLVYGLVKSKDLGACQFNKAWRISKRELERYRARKEGRALAVSGIEEAFPRRQPS